MSENEIKIIWIQKRTGLDFQEISSWEKIKMWGWDQNKDMEASF